MNMLRVGLIINPFSGLGGSVALKGSDNVIDQALALGAEAKSSARTEQVLTELLAYKSSLEFVSASGAMGGDLLAQLGFQVAILDQKIPERSCSEDTKLAAASMLSDKVDLILFAGGDGTARDICSVVGSRVPVLGIPAGVKIHSAVYAVNPQSAVEVLKLMLEGELTRLREADVRDIDEEAFRQGQVKARLYGEMMVPEEAAFLQNMKCGGIEKEEWVLADIAAEVIEQMEDDVLYIVGSGATTQAVMEELQLENTLLGVDLVCNHSLVAADVTESQLLDYMDQYQQFKLIITVIGGQGHILGRGNQQLSPKVIRKLGRDNIVLIATKAKLKTLEGRPLLVDSGDRHLDRELCGWLNIVSGYQEQVVYPVSDGIYQVRSD